MEQCVKYMKTHWEIPGSQNCRALFLPRQIAADLRRPHPPPKHQECLSEWPCKMLAPAWHQRTGAAGSRKRSVLLCFSSSFVSKSTSVPRTRTFDTSVHVHAVDSHTEQVKGVTLNMHTYIYMTKICKNIPFTTRVRTFLGCEDLLAGSHNFTWMFECWVV